MQEISANLRLRPTRIGFLVKPNDLGSIRKIMRINACLWGGMYNPIIPVFRNSPADWKNERFEYLKGYEIAKGYIKFFEPDVYVEAEAGLLEKVGLSELKSSTTFNDYAVGLSKFMFNEYRGLHEPFFGQSIYDLLCNEYEKERKFKLRDEHPAILQRNNVDTFAESCIGAYPSANELQYFFDTYTNVYKPQEVQSRESLIKSRF